MCILLLKVDGTLMLRAMAAAVLFFAGVSCDSAPPSPNVTECAAIRAMAVTQLRVSDRTHHSLDFVWSSPESGSGPGPDITSYKVQILCPNTTMDPRCHGEWRTLEEVQESESHMLNLIPSSAYQVRVLSLDINGTIAGCTATLMAFTPPTNPNSIPSPSLVSRDWTSITINWTAVQMCPLGDCPDRAPRYRYQVQMAEDGGGSWRDVTWRDVTGLEPLLTSHKQDKLQRGESYQFRVRAVDMGNPDRTSPWSPEASFMTLTAAPEPPSIDLHCFTDSTVDLSWEWQRVNSGDPVVSVTVQLCVGKQEAQFVKAGNYTATDTQRLQLIGLAPDTDYGFRAAVCAATACSDMSPILWVHTAQGPTRPPPKPLVPKFMDQDLHSVTLELTWPPCVGFGGISLAVQPPGEEEWTSLLSVAAESLVSTGTNAVMRLSYGGMVTGQPYQFQLKYSNGLGEAVRVFDAFTQPTVPAAPLLTASATKMDGKTVMQPSAHLKWDRPDAMGSAVLEYVLECQNISLGDDQWLQVARLPAKQKRVDLDLAPKQDFLFRIYAVNAVGNGTLSASVYTKLTNAPQKPEPIKLCKENVQYAAGTMVNGNAGGSSAEECWALCNDSPECLFWDWEGDHCRLRSDGGNGAETYEGSQGGGRGCRLAVVEEQRGAVEQSMTLNKADAHSLTLSWPWPEANSMRIKAARVQMRTTPLEQEHPRQAHLSWTDLSLPLSVLTQPMALAPGLNCTCLPAADPQGTKPTACTTVPYVFRFCVSNADGWGLWSDPSQFSPLVCPSEPLGGAGRARSAAVQHAMVGQLHVVNVEGPDELLTEQVHRIRI